MSFLADREKSHEAVNALERRFQSFGLQTTITPDGKNAEQAYGDMEVSNGEESIFVEVKFDIMAAKTNNLCFEISKGKVPTGISTTKADRIYYVVPFGENYKVWAFNPQRLREFIKTSKRIRLTNGGDGWKFKLVIVSIKEIMDSFVMEECFILRETCAELQV